MIQKETNELLQLLREIKLLLEKQNEIIENQQSSSATKITVVGTSGTTSTKGLKSDEDFSL